MKENNTQNGTSPLAEGRELKLVRRRRLAEPRASPLAEGRELKFKCAVIDDLGLRVAPRGGA